MFWNYGQNIRLKEFNVQKSEQKKETWNVRQKHDHPVHLTSHSHKYPSRYDLHICVCYLYVVHCHPVQSQAMRGALTHKLRLITAALINNQYKWEMSCSLSGSDYWWWLGNTYSLVWAHEEMNCREWLSLSNRVIAVACNSFFFGKQKHKTFSWQPQVVSFTSLPPLCSICHSL